MRFLLLALALSSSAATAQIIMDPAKFPGGVKNLLERHEGELGLKCEVTPIRPMLNFGFRFQAGYVVRVPLNQYSGSGHGWATVAKITPEDGGGKPVYLVSAMKLPDIPKTDARSQVGGGYLLGEGRYRVEWALVDDLERVCRKDWSVDVALSRSERKVKVAMPANSVGELSLRGLAPAIASKDDVRPFRIVTVMLHAAPLFPRRTKMRPGDTLMLQGSLGSLLERLPAQSVRLVVFNLEQQNEIFRQDGFTPEALDRVAQAMNQLELGLVDYRVLQNRRGHIELLAGLVNKELEAKEPADAVVFLGPASRFFDKPPQAALEKPHGAIPRFFYFQFKPYSRRGATFPDSIQYVIARLKGKTSVIHSPGEFAKAIEELESRVGGLR